MSRPALQPLPVDAVLPEIRAALAHPGAFVLVAPPGAGKTTRVPPALADLLPGQIWLVEPRRVAARAAARRMATEAGQSVGDRFGWQIRFERRASAHTRVLVVTEGILLRRLQSDPFLEGIDAVVLDEFHERSILADLSLALLREVRADARPDLRVGVMSATLDPAPVARFLGDAAVVRSEGRTYPVDLHHRSDLDSAAPEDAVAAAVRDALAEREGDILAFLPGVREIRRAHERLAGVAAEVLPLHGRLSAAEQDRALGQGTRRRVVLATNVAESSVTVPGVQVVVDGGWVRQPRFDQRTGLPRLETVRISLASADQRAGRAGRRGPGHCVRVWSTRVHQALDPYDAPQIRHADLAGPALQLLAWGSDPATFGWFEAPPAAGIAAARTLLERLGATRHGQLTAQGRRLASLPLHPRLAAMLLTGARLGHPRIAADIAARLADGPLTVPDRARATESDVLDALERPASRGVARVASQLEREVRDVATDTLVPGPEAVGRAVLAGWPDRVALRRAEGSPRARMVGGRGVVLDRRSGVRAARLFVALDVADAQPEGRVRVATEVDESWLEVEEGRDVSFDPASGAVRARMERRYEDLVLASHPVEIVPAEASAVLVQVAAARLDDATPADRSLDTVLARLRFVGRLPSAEPWPEPDESFLESLLPTLCHGRRSLDELRRADWIGAIRDGLGWSRWQALQRLAPEHYEAPSGRSFRISWSPDGPPVLAIPMQHLFGLTRTPTVADGRVPLTLHLLAPSGRAQQITDDLPGFWARTWPEVRKELRARYPKHAWPEDPLTAAPGGPGRRRRG